MDKLAEIRIPGVWNTKSRLSVTPYNSIKIIVLFILTLAISWEVVWVLGRNKVLVRVMFNMKG